MAILYYVFDGFFDPTSVFESDSCLTEINEWVRFSQHLIQGSASNRVFGLHCDCIARTISEKLHCIATEFWQSRCDCIALLAISRDCIALYSFSELDCDCVALH